MLSRSNHIHMTLNSQFSDNDITRTPGKSDRHFSAMQIGYYNFPFVELKRKHRALRSLHRVASHRIASHRTVPHSTVCKKQPQKTCTTRKKDTHKVLHNNRYTYERTPVILSSNDNEDDFAVLLQLVQLDLIVNLAIALLIYGFVEFILACQRTECTAEPEEETGKTANPIKKLRMIGKQ